MLGHYSSEHDGFELDYSGRLQMPNIKNESFVN